MPQHSYGPLWATRETPPAGEVILLLRGDTLTDSSTYAHSITAAGAETAVVTTPAFFAPNSIRIRNLTPPAESGQAYLNVPYNPVFALGSGDWCIETFVRFEDLSFSRYIFEFYRTGANPIGMFVVSNELRWTPGGGVTQGFPAASMVNDTWYHVAMARVGGNMHAYFQGVLLGQVAAQTSYDFEPSHPGLTGLTIGKNSAVSSFNMRGYVEQFRFYKGLSPYTESTYTIPAAPF